MRQSHRQRHTTAASKRPRLSQNHQQQQALRIPLLARKATSSSESTSTSSFQSSDSASSTSSDSRSDASDDSSTTSSGSAQGLAAPGRSFSSGPTSSAAGAATETTATTTPSGLPPLGASYATGARLAQDLFSTRRSSAELTDRAASAAQTTATQASATALFPPPAQRQPEQQCTPAVHLHGQQLRPISPAPKRPRHQQQLGSVRATPTHMQDLDLDFVAAPTIPVGGDVPLPHPETSYFQQFRNLQAKAGSSSNNRSGTGGGGCAGMKDRLADEREKERESERNSTRSEQWFPSHHLFDPTAHSAPPCPDMMGLLDDTLRTIKQRLQSESRNGGGGEEWSEGEMQAVEQQREVSGDTTAASGLDDVPVQWKIERGGHTLLDEDENEKEAPGSLFLPTGTGVNVEAEVEAEDVAAGNSYRSNAVDRVDAVCDTAMPSSASSASSPIIHPVSRRRRHRTGTLHESDSNLSLADAAATTIASTAAATFNTTAAAVASAHYISSMYDITITDITEQSPSPAQQQQSIGQGNVGYFTHAGVGEEEDEDHEDNVSPFSFHGSRAEDRFSTVDSEAPAAVDAAVAAAEYEVKSEGGNGCDGDGDNMVRDRNQGGEEGVEEEDFVFWMQDEDGVYYQADSAGNLM